MSYPEPVDAQVVTEWPIVDRYREAYARAHSMRLGVERTRQEAERRLARPYPAPFSEKAFRRYTDLMRRLPLAERLAWNLQAQADGLGPEVADAMKRARHTVEAMAAHRWAARDARLEHEARHRFG